MSSSESESFVNPFEGTCSDIDPDIVISPMVSSSSSGRDVQVNLPKQKGRGSEMYPDRKDR